MAEKKYQVFISSTYSDLVDERRRILDILLMADCIPAGMEAFVATDVEQFDVGLTETGIDNILRSKLFGEDSYWYSFDDPQFVKQILNQFKAAGLLHSSWNKSKSTLFWSLSKKGVLTRDQMMLIKKS